MTNKEIQLTKALKVALVSLCADGTNKKDYWKALGSEQAIQQLLDDTEEFRGKEIHVEDVILEALDIPNHRLD